MKPGRELDALVAEKVMGVVPPVDFRVCPICDEVIGRGAENPPPYFRLWCGRCGEWKYSPVSEYSTDISAAWEILERIITDWSTGGSFRGFGYGFKLEHCTEFSEEKWICTLPETTCAPPFEEMNEDLYVVGESAPHAICLASLKAVGHKFGT